MTYSRSALAAVLTLLFIASAAAAELRAGPMVGATAMRAVKIWVQADAAGNAEIQYWDTQAPEKIMRTRAVALAEDSDFVAHFDVVALEPGRTYGYRVNIDGREQKLGQSLTFKTQTLWQWRSDAPDWKLVFGSCAYTNEPAYDRPGVPYGGPPEAMQIYDSMAGQRPDLTLWGGDYLYFREADYDSEWGLGYRWKRERGIPEVQNLLRTGSHVAIWDDHDFGPNDSNASYVFKGTTFELFKRYWANASYGLPETPGTFGNFRFNDAEFFLVDNRSYRDSDQLLADDKSKLGTAQMRWLKNALLASTAPLKIIALGSQVTNNANTKAEGWDKFPKERAEILKFLLAQKLDGVLLLTGDRHFTELLKTERPGSYPLYELTCSPLTSGVPSGLDSEKANPQVVPGTFVAQRNFCTVEFSGAATARKLTLRSFSTMGKKLWEREIALSELRTHAASLE